MGVPRSSERAVPIFLGISAVASALAAQRVVFEPSVRAEAGGCFAAVDPTDDGRGLEQNRERLMPLELNAPDAVARALERITLSYGHMTSTCPMGSVLDADCRVHGIEGLRVVDASSMPTIPSGNTYLGCVMVAERVARKMALISKRPG